MIQHFALSHPWIVAYCMGHTIGTILWFLYAEYKFRQLRRRYRVPYKDRIYYHKSLDDLEHTVKDWNPPDF